MGLGFEIQVWFREVEGSLHTSAVYEYTVVLREFALLRRFEVASNRMITSLLGRGTSLLGRGLRARLDRPAKKDVVVESMLEPLPSRCPDRPPIRKGQWNRAYAHYEWAHT